MLRITGLTKLYGGQTALSDFTAEVGAGQIVAVVGPNGAGKTTLFASLVGVIDDFTGSVEMDGTRLADWPRSQIGFLAGDPFFYPRLTGIQMIGFERAMRRIEVSDERVFALLGLLGAERLAGKRMAAMSAGQQKRIMIACALLGAPKLLIMDEPLNALDVETVLRLKDLLDGLRAAGSHILISSHSLGFVDELADRVLLLDHGRMVDEFCPQTLPTESAYRQAFLD